MAYVDQGNISIKLTYWSGSTFATEVVAGDGTATFLALGLTSDNVPVITWTLGTNLKAAIRSTPLGMPGRWDAGIIDVGTAPRAVNLSINPLNQSSSSFRTDTAVTGRAKGLFGDTGCSRISQFQTMNTTVTVDNNPIVAAQTGMGLSWCQASPTTYYPMVAFGGNTNQIRFAICKNSLATCLNGANWSAVNAFASASVNSTFATDPNLTDDVPKIVSLKPATGIKTYKMGTTGCTGTLAAFSESAGTIGTATSGTVWLSALLDATGIFHIAANEAATSVRYYNSQTTDITGAWNAAGTVETVALAAAMKGGASLAGTSMYISYGQAAAPFDLRLAKVNNLATSSTAATFSRFTPDTSGSIQMVGANLQVKNLATAKTSDGKLAVAYVDHSNGAVAAAKLKYALRLGKAFSDAWITTFLPLTNTPSFPALAFDSENRPWVAFYEGSGTRYQLMNNTETDGSGAWSIYEFPYVPGAPKTLPAANQVGLVILTEAGISKPVLIVADNKAGTMAVRAAKFNPLTLSWGPLATIDSPGVSGISHLTAEAQGANIVLGYYDITLGKVKYNYSSDGDTWMGSGTSYAFSGLNRGIGATLRIHPTTQSPIASYYDKVNNRLYFAECSGTFATCFSGGWTETVIENGTLGISGLAAGQEQVLTASLNVNNGGVISILYPRGAGTSGDLMLAHNASGAWETLPFVGANNGALPGSPALNFGIAGWNPVHISNDFASPAGAFVGPGNWLYQFSCGD